MRLGGGSGWYLRVCPRVCPALAENHQNANPFAQNVGLLKMTRASAKNPDPRAGHSRHLTLLSIAIHAVLNQSCKVLAAQTTSVVTPVFTRYHKIAAKAPCNVFDPWAHWEKGPVGI